MKEPDQLKSETLGLQARILIVEDQAIIAEDLTEILGDFGCLVVGVARHCDEAWPMLETVRPDLVLMDLDSQRETTGLLAAVRIQQQTRVPVVCLTACTSVELGPALEMEKTFGLVHKPIQVDEFAAALRRALGGLGKPSPS